MVGFEQWISVLYQFDAFNAKEKKGVLRLQRKKKINQI